jgi:hypothetical protein
MSPCTCSESSYVLCRVESVIRRRPTCLFWMNISLALEPRLPEKVHLLKEIRGR